MSRDVAAAVAHCNQTFPTNAYGHGDKDRAYRIQILHNLEGPEKGPGEIHLTPGPVSTGTGPDGNLNLPPDIGEPTARVAARSKPVKRGGKSSRRDNLVPDMRDQIRARAFPHVEHIMQAPATRRGKSNPYYIYTGALPPRYYTLVDNPLNLPVPPHSPDGDQLPPFHPHPGGI
jgi:hypothetical protein